MRRLVALLLILMAVPAWAIRQQFVNNEVSVTDTNTTVTFTDNHSGGNGAAFRAAEILVCNQDTTNSIYVDVVDGVATTSDRRLQPLECEQWAYTPTPVTPSQGFLNVGIICSGSETATVSVEAVR
jgi:predicted outer membrane repeat protein